MELDEARAILRGDEGAPPAHSPYLDNAIATVLERLDTIDRRARQIRGGLKPYASPVEIVDFLLAEVKDRCLRRGGMTW